MTEKGDVLAYLAEVQRMQMEATKLVITITSYPDICGFGVKFAEEAYSDIYYILRAYSERENRGEMKRIREVFNKYEKR